MQRARAKAEAPVSHLEQTTTVHSGLPDGGGRVRDRAGTRRHRDLPEPGIRPGRRHPRRAVAQSTSITSWTDDVGTDLSKVDTLEVWQAVLDQLNLGEMPPGESPQPAATATG